MPTTTYGSSAVGADEKNIKNQKRNLAVATGKGLSVGASNTLAIEMTYGNEAQPDIRAHMSHIEAWLRYYDKYRTCESKRILMEAAWCKALAKIEGKNKAGGQIDDTNALGDVGNHSQLETYRHGTGKHPWVDQQPRRRARYANHTG